MIEAADERDRVLLELKAALQKGGRLMWELAGIIEAAEAAVRSESHKSGVAYQLETKVAKKAEPDLERVIGIQEVSDMLGLARQTIWRMRRSGKFPAPIDLPTRRIAFRASDIADWLANPGCRC